MKRVLVLQSLTVPLSDLLFLMISSASSVKLRPAVSKVHADRDLLCRAVLVQFGFFGHMKRVLGLQSLTVTRPLIFAAAFMLLFSIVIALFKDIPDVKGDSQVG